MSPKWKTCWRSTSVLMIQNVRKSALTKAERNCTPEHGSWLNMAECELSVLARQCLDRRIPDIETLADEAACWEQRRNAMKVKIHWHFTAADARIKLRRLYPVLKELPGSPCQVPTE